MDRATARFGNNHGGAFLGNSNSEAENKIKKFNNLHSMSKIKATVTCDTNNLTEIKDESPPWLT